MQHGAGAGRVAIAALIVGIVGVLVTVIAIVVAHQDAAASFASTAAAAKPAAPVASRSGGVARDASQQVVPPSPSDTPIMTTTTAPGASGGPAAPGLQWYTLASLRTVQDDGIERVGAVTIGGKTYYDSVDIGAWWGTSWALYDLGHVCTRFKVTVGTTDASPTEEISHNVVLLDGKQIAVADTPIGTVRTLEADITGGFRLKITSAFPTHRGNQDVGWGDAQIYCTQAPG